VHEHIFAAGFLLDEAEAFLRVEEFHHAFAGADNLRGHAVEPAAASAAAGAARAAGATRAAAKAAAIAKTTAIAAAKAAAIISGALIAEAAGRCEISAAAERIEAVFAEAVTFVFAAAAPPIVTHKSIHTLSHRR
jgi:hypothetical protein